MNEKLKLCPFCGDKPYTQSWTEKTKELSTDVSKVTCNCGVSGPERYGYDSFTKAEKVWNNRI